MKYSIMNERLEDSSYSVTVAILMYFNNLRTNVGCGINQD